MPAPAELQLQKSAEDTLTVALTGSWKLGEALPSADEVQQRARRARRRFVTLSSTPGSWRTGTAGC